MKKRFELFSTVFNDSIEDHKTGSLYNGLNLENLVDLLNEQDQKIKKLEADIEIWKSKAEHMLEVCKEQSAKDLEKIYALAEKINQLQQSQNQKAIEVLEQLLGRYNFYQNSDNDTLVEPVPNDIMIPILTYVLDQISELKGDKTCLMK